ncbi:MAG: hypothetical protein EKK55_22470 [Rhodocyclaceae bacterium]|nr:MAG: hypothetical protein EKK55_22470 [Rhodocyclaceae bacterium]
MIPNNPDYGIDGIISKESLEFIKSGTKKCTIIDGLVNTNFLGKKLRFWDGNATVLGLALISHIEQVKITCWHINDVVNIGNNFLFLATSKYVFNATICSQYVDMLKLEFLQKNLCIDNEEFYKNFYKELKEGEDNTFYKSIVYFKDFWTSCFDRDVESFRDKPIIEKSLALGIIPAKTWVQERIISLHNAILCSYDNDEPIPHELISEYQELVTIRGAKQ